MLCFLLAEVFEHKLDHEMCAPSTSRILTFGICHLPEPGCHNTETWISLVSQGLIHCLSPDDMLRSHIGVSFLSTCPTKNSSEEAIRGDRQKVIHTNTDLHPTPLPSEGATWAGRDVAVTTGPFPNAPQNRVGAVLCSTYCVSMASYLLGCHMFKIILLPDVCQSFPF